MRGLRSCIYGCASVLLPRVARTSAREVGQRSAACAPRSQGMSSPRPARCGCVARAMSVGARSAAARSREFNPLSCDAQTVASQPLACCDRQTWLQPHIYDVQTIKLDGCWSSLQQANNTPPLSVAGSGMAPFRKDATMRVSYMDCRTYTYMFNQAAPRSCTTQPRCVTLLLTPPHQ